MIAPVQDIKEARVSATESLKDGLIPVFEAEGIEVARNTDSEVIVYCENLKQVQDIYKFTNKCNDSEIKEELVVEKNSLCIIKLPSMNEDFASKDLLEVAIIS